MKKRTKKSDVKAEVLKIVIDTLHELGGQATVTDLRFATKFRHQSREITGALLWLKARGVVAFSSLRPRNEQGGLWSI